MFNKITEFNSLFEPLHIIMTSIQVPIQNTFPQKRNPTLPYQDKKEKHKFVGNNIERETNYTVWLQIIYLANR